eukprot:9485603-Pyramimonas_sp.AAC.2
MTAVGFFHFNSDNFFRPFIPPAGVSREGNPAYGWGGVLRGTSMAFFGYIGFDEVRIRVPGLPVRPTRPLGADTDVKPLNSTLNSPPNPPHPSVPPTYRPVPRHEPVRVWRYLSENFTPAPAVWKFTLAVREYNPGRLGIQPRCLGIQPRPSGNTTPAVWEYTPGRLGVGKYNPGRLGIQPRPFGNTTPAVWM